MQTLEWEHEGVKIEVDGKGCFAYKVDGEPDRQFDTLREARESITQTHKAQRRSPINLSVLNYIGEPVTLRRIHEGTGDWLTEPKGVDHPYYVNEPGVAEALKRIKQARLAIDILHKVVADAKIEYKRIYGRSDADAIDAATASFRAGIEAATTRWAARPADNKESTP